jgi:hypothetical protein
MFRRSHGVAERMSTAAQAVAGYVDPLTKDDRLRKRLAEAITAGAAVRQQVRRQTGLRGAIRLASDPVLVGQIKEAASHLQAAQRRARRARSHKLRNAVLFAGGAAAVVAAVPSLRHGVMSKLGLSHSDDIERISGLDGQPEL